MGGFFQNTNGTAAPSSITGPNATAASQPPTDPVAAMINSFQQAALQEYSRRSSDLRVPTQSIPGWGNPNTFVLPDANTANSLEVIGHFLKSLNPDNQAIGRDLLRDQPEMKKYK